jgi:small subunit ribosomal protein S18
MCAGKAVDYKDLNIITKYISENGKILPRRFTGTCAKHQREVAKQVKLARYMGFIPFCK